MELNGLFIQVKRITVKEGFSSEIINKFSREGIIEKQEGFIELNVMVKKIRRGDEEVMIMIKWESEEYWKQWEKSDAHIAGHKANLGKPKPDFHISSEGGLYDLVAVKKKAPIEETIG